MKKAKLDKYIEFGTTKFKSIFKEKKFKFEGHEIKYVLETSNKNDNLIVVFSGIPRPGIKARYNYMRTLKEVDANKLFILDDLGYDERGGYYLGKNKDFYMERATLNLIGKVKKDLNIQNTIYCGSSKGGWASLYFGIRDNNSTVVAGSLQYLLGNYITSNERTRTNLMSFVMGKDYTNKDIEYLNGLLKGTIQRNKNNSVDIHFHYSDAEYTYEDHMVHLLKDLDEFGVKYETDVAHYEKHEDLAFYFPPFLVKTLKEVL